MLEASWHCDGLQVSSVTNLTTLIKKFVLLCSRFECVWIGSSHLNSPYLYSIQTPSRSLLTLEAIFTSGSVWKIGYSSRVIPPCSLFFFFSSLFNPRRDISLTSTNLSLKLHIVKQWDQVDSAFHPVIFSPWSKFHTTQTRQKKQIGFPEIWL